MQRNWWEKCYLWNTGIKSEAFFQKKTLHVPAADSHRDYVHSIIDTGMELDIQKVQNFNLADCYVLVAF